jgi:ABC-type branched-subunit amino acid transport system substrate-binding protein
MAKRTVSRREALVGSAVAGGLGLLGASAPSSIRRTYAADVSDTTIKVGVTAGLTGPIAFASGQFVNYMKAYFDKINVDGIHGRKIHVIAVDDGSKGDVALQNVRRLVQEENVFAVTTIGTATTAGILDYLTSENTPFLFPAAYNTELVSPPRTNTFALYQPFEGQIPALIKWAFGFKGAGTNVIVRANTPSLDLAAQSAERATKDRGGKLLTTLSTVYNQPEWSSIVIQLKELKPDYITVLTIAPDMGRFWKEISLQKAFPGKAMLGINPLADNGFIDTAGPVPDDMVFAAVPGTRVQTAPEADGVRNLRPGEKLGLFGVQGAASAAVMAEAFRQAGRDIVREKFLQLLTSCFGPFSTPFTDIARSAPNHLLIPTIGVATIRNGQYVAATNKYIE